MTCIIPHPGAASAVLKAVNERNHTFYHATGPVKIQVLDKYMAILCYDVVVDDNEFTDYFQLWAWKADKDFKGVSPPPVTFTRRIWETGRFTETVSTVLHMGEISGALVP